MKTLSIKKLTDNFILCYLYWIAFEWTFLSRISNYTVIQYIRNFIDLVPILALAIIVGLKNVKFKSIDLKILVGFFVIVCISSLSLFLEINSVLPIVSYIGVTLRFIPFLIIIKYTSESFNLRFFKHIKIVYWIQIALTFLCIINKSFILMLLLPPSEVFGAEQPTIYNDPGITTTFINTIEYSFFILGLTIIYLVQSKNKVEKSLVFACSLVATILSFSIASILGLLLAIFIFLDRKYKIMFLLATSILILVVVFSNVAFFKILLGMDIETWIQISSDYNRIGYFTKLMPEFLNGNLKDIFLGFGYDGGIVGKKLAHYASAPRTLIDNSNNLKYLKDVYWISIILSQGVIVFFITSWILYIIYKQAKKSISKEYFFIVKIFLAQIIFIGLFNQIMDVKGFTFCFWIEVAIVLNSPRFVLLNKKLLPV